MTELWVQVIPMGCTKDGCEETGDRDHCVHAVEMPEACYEQGCPDADPATPWLCVHKRPAETWS